MSERYHRLPDLLVKKSCDVVPRCVEAVFKAKRRAGPSIAALLTENGAGHAARYPLLIRNSRRFRLVLASRRAAAALRHNIGT